MKIKLLDVFKENIADIADERIVVKREKSLEKAGRVIKDLRLNRNWSWYDELFFRNQDNLDAVAISYRGVEFTYQEMFDKMNEYAKSLKSMGIDKGTEIPICMSNTPEFVFLLGAVSIIGAKANVFGADFEKDYVRKIIDECDSDILFIEDNEYEKINDIIPKTHIKKMIMTSLSNSFKNGIDPYAEMDKKYADRFRSRVELYKSGNDSIIDISEFLENGNNYVGNVHEKVCVDDVFTVTYSSGTTSKTPKPILHAHKSFNFVTRFHDSDVNHTPSYRNFSMQANVPTYSSTGLISGISDALTQGCKLSLEPIYEEDFVVDSLIINRPSYVDFTKSFWLRFAKDILYNPKYKNTKLPELLICFSVGEVTERNEEKFINKALKKVGAGKKIFPIVPITRISIAGGDCEHGGIFYCLLRAYQNMNPVHKIMNEDAGMGTFSLVDLDVLDKDGNHCKPYKLGNLVATSELDMLGYKNNPEATEAFYITAANGKKYGNCFVDAYQDYFGKIHIKGRQEGIVSTFNIDDCILDDRKNILSCTTVKCGNYYVAHIEFVPGRADENILVDIEKRVIKKLGSDFASKLVYRIHSFEESFKLTHSGKRDKLDLLSEGITDKCLKPIIENNTYSIVNASEYFDVSKHKIMVK